MKDGRQTMGDGRPGAQGTAVDRLPSVVTETRMLVTSIQPDGVQLFKELPAQFGTRTVRYPYLIKVGADGSLMRELERRVAIGDEIDVTLADNVAGALPSMRLVSFAK